MTAADEPESILQVIDVDDQRLETAKTHLQQVDLVGFSEDYDAFTDAVARRYGWTIKAQGKWWESTEDWQVEPSLVKRIEQDQEADIEFYEFARTHAGASAAP